MGLIPQQISYWKRIQLESNSFFTDAGFPIGLYVGVSVYKLCLKKYMSKK